MTEWDPIGVKGIAPKDEYDCCIDGIVGLLNSGASRDELVSYLRDRELEHFQSPPKEDRDFERRRIAAKLTDAWIQIRRFNGAPNSRRDSESP